MQILSEVISLAGYLHSDSIFLNCANVDIAYNTQSQYHVVPKKIVTFVQLLQECECFYNIQLFSFYQYKLFD